MFALFAYYFSTTNPNSYRSEKMFRNFQVKVNKDAFISIELLEEIEDLVMRSIGAAIGRGSKIFQLLFRLFFRRKFLKK